MNKLGPHIIRNTAAAIAWARRAAIVKSIDDPGPLAVAPDWAIRVFRCYFADQDRVASLGADAIARAIVTALRGYNHPRLYVEVFNEWRQRIDEIAYHADVLEEAARALHAAGYKVAGFSFSTGNPEPEVWHFIQAHNFCSVDAIAIHEYWAAQGFSTWNALRYRRAHEWLGGQHPPFIITECGRDAISDEGAAGKPGWQKQGITGDQYVKELIAYDAELQKDRYVLGGVVFTCGPYSDFSAFDVDTLVPKIPAPTSTIYVPEVKTVDPNENHPYIKQYLAQYRAWRDAGGVVNNFMTYIAGQKALGGQTVTAEELRACIGRVHSAAQELKLVSDKYPFA